MYRFELRDAHVPSGETMSEPAGAVDDEIDVVRVLVVMLDVVVGIEPPPLAERYQFAAGSPRHSPTVTAR